MPQCSGVKGLAVADNVPKAKNAAIAMVLIHPMAELCRVERQGQGRERPAAKPVSEGPDFKAGDPLVLTRCDFEPEPME